MTNIATEIRLVGRGRPRTLDCLVMQSPLAGVSDQIFRSLIRRWAPNALLFTEMVNATSLDLGNDQGKLVGIEKEKGPIGVQLFDSRPNSMADAAKRAEASGAFVIDINMGCPVHKITRKGGGSGLIKKPDLAAKIVNAVANAIEIPVTVKTRLGWSNNPYDPIGFAKRLESAGAQLITVHGRTREEGFSGLANWNGIAEVKQALKIPVIANGDVNSAEKALQCLEATKANGVMVGRGSMGAPWLIGQIHSAIQGREVFKTPDLKVRLDIAHEHLLALVEAKGDKGLLIARKHLGWTCSGFPGASQLRKSLMQAQTYKEAVTLLENQKKLLD